MTEIQTQLYRPYRPRHATRRRIAAAEVGVMPRLVPGRDAADFTIGLEEELFVVDAASLDCVTQMPPAFLREAEAALGSHVKR